MTCMSIAEATPWIIASVTTIGAVASAALAFRNNASGVKNDVINTYEKRVKQLEEAVEELSTKIDDLTKKLDKSESERSQYLAILQGQNPEVKGYMERTEKMLIEIHGAVMPQTVTPTE